MTTALPKTPADASRQAPTTTAPQAAAAPDTATPATAATPAVDPRRWAVLAVVLFAAVLDLLDATITNIAAPTIAADLGGGPALVQWLGAAYALAMGVLLVVGGRLGDKYGRRRLFLTGLAGFTLASAACGLATGPASVIAFRILQGLRRPGRPAGLRHPLRGLPPRELGKAFGVFAPASACPPSAARSSPDS
ncbi:MFS transporter [Kitasatospora aburaviensis]